MDTTRNSSSQEMMTAHERVLEAIKILQGKKGVTLQELKKFLHDGEELEAAIVDADIKQAIKTYMDQDVLSIKDGRYKVKEAKRRRKTSKSGKSHRSRSRSRPKSKSRKRSGSKRKSSGKRKRSRSKSRRRKRTSRGRG